MGWKGEMSLRTSQGFGRPLGAVLPRWALRSEEAVGHGPWPLPLCFCERSWRRSTLGAAARSSLPLPPGKVSAAHCLLLGSGHTWLPLPSLTLLPLGVPGSQRWSCIRPAFCRLRPRERRSQGQTQALQLLGGAKGASLL